MTSTDAAATADDIHLDEWGGDDGGSPRRRRRRVPAPKANWAFRFVFPLVILGLGLVTFQLWREGTKAVLDSTDGTLIEIVSDPNAPGYEAIVAPTPTLLVVHTDDGDRLTGVTVLARTLLDNGGQGVLLPADMAANGVGGPTLADRFASGGVDAVERELGALFGFGFVETAVFSTRDLGLVLQLAEPIPYALLDDLVAVDAEGSTEIWLTAGVKQLPGDVAAELYSWRNPNEADANRSVRQLDLWESWLLVIASADDVDEVVLPLDEGLAPYLRAFGVGQSDLQIVPAAPDDPAAARPTYVLDDDAQGWLVEVAERMTPLPIAPLGSDLATVRLLDGTGDRRVAQAALDSLARLAEITVFGNAGEFGQTQTTVSYHDQSAASAAEDLAAQIGGEALFDPRPDDPVDLTIVIGTDWEAP